MNYYRKGFLRGRVVSFYEVGMSEREIAERLGIGKSTVHEWIVKHRQGRLEPRFQTGRPKKTSERANRRLCRLANSDPCISASRLQTQWGENVSVWTVYRRLRTRLLRKYRRLLRPLLTRENRHQRELWCRRYNLWLENRWHRVVWSDESRFRLFTNDGRVRVWRKRGERLNKRFIKETVTAGGGSVHVWGAFWRGGRSRLRVLRGNVTGQTYIQTLTDFIQTEGLPQRWILQDDNATAHRSAIVRRFKELNGIETLPWPAKSPDLNPIEHVWDRMGREIQAREQRPANLRQLEDSLVDVWNDIPQDYLDTLADSIRRRIGAVLESKGGPTRY